MRFHFLVAMAFVSSALITACSAETDSSLLHRGSGASAAKAKGGGGPASPARSPEASTEQPAAGPGAGSAPAATPAAAGAPATPATPLRTNVCENPTCTAGNGACGCTAVDTSGHTVQMDCQGGVCTCTTGDQITTQVGDDNCANDGDARTLYSASCGCL
jgi:hypothetical protein